MNNRTFSQWIFNSFPLSAEGLALYRIFVALYLLLFLMPSTQMYHFLGSLPSDFYAPPPGPMGLFSGFPSTTFFYVLHGGLIASILCMLAGYKTRYASIATGLCLIIIKGFFYSVGKINHDFLMIVVPVIMAFSGWGARYSVDSRLDGTASNSSPVQNWPITLLVMIIGFMMFTAGFPKILGGWLDPTTHATYGHFFKQYFVNGRQDLLASQFMQLDNLVIWELMDYLTIIIETGFIIAILHPKTTRIFMSLAVLFHVGVMLMLNIAFAVNLMAYAAVLDWDYIHRKLKNLFPDSFSYGPAIVVGAVFLVFELFLWTASRYGIPNLTSDLNLSHFYILILALPIALIHLGYTGTKEIQRLLRT